jgi:hypothetical protein
MDFSGPLVNGGSVFKGGNEMRHTCSVRRSDPVGNEDSDGL